MKAVLSFVGVVTVVLGIGSLALADDIWLASLDDAKHLARKTNKPILCHFYADWCGPCQVMERQVFPSQQVREHLKNSVIAVKVDVRQQPHLANRFSVTNLPMDIVLEPSGAEIVQSTGFRTASEYTSLLNRAHTRYADLLAERAAQQRQADSYHPGDVVKPVASSEAMMKGFCPVTLWKTRRWEKGSPQFHSEYKGQRFQFAGREELELFQQSPERYVPQFLGCDPVVVWETDQAVGGSIQYGAFYDERLYLFTSDQNRQRFKASPDQFIETKVVLHVSQIQQITR